MGRFGGKKEKGKLCDYNIKNIFKKRSLTLPYGSAATICLDMLSVCLSVCMYTYVINNSSSKSLIQKDFLPQRPLWTTHAHSASCLLRIPHLQPFSNFGKIFDKADLGFVWSTLNMSLCVIFSSKVSCLKTGLLHSSCTSQGRNGPQDKLGLICSYRCINLWGALAFKPHTKRKLEDAFHAPSTPVLFFWSDLLPSNLG